MPNVWYRLHTTFEGDAALALPWVPFGKAKLRELLQRSGNWGQKFTPSTGVEVHVRVVGEDKFIHIKATGGCNDRRGFLLSKQGQAYDALYNDGVSENINPISGSPRPVPDSAVRTKGYKVPPQLRVGQPARVSASKFSGLMRLAVGCYHAAGKDAPFSHSYAVTHGIVKKTFTLNNESVTRYWVVEISTLGVYAAPIANTGKCCDSWSVAPYMASAADRALNPALNTLSLRSAFIIGRSDKIRELVGAFDMQTAYGDGSPFGGEGWAFSASGAEAQQVMQDVFSTPAFHYKTARWKITFSVAAGSNLEAALTAIERGKITTLSQGSTVWAPATAGLWIAYEAANPTMFPNPFTTFPSQDAPVHVFYAGETAKVTRWTLGYALVAEDFLMHTAPFFTGETVTETSCKQSGIFSWQRTETGHGGYEIGAHANITLGFSGPDFSHLGSSYTRSERTITHSYSSNITTTGSGSNFYNLHPSCYYVDEETGELVTQCGYTFTSELTTVASSLSDRRVSATSTQLSSIVLFPEEREAVLAVTTLTTGDTGIVISQDQAQILSTHLTLTKSDGGPCPFTTEDGDTLNASTDPSVTPFTTDVNSRSDTGSAALVLGNNAFTAPITFTGAPFYDVANYDLGTFLVQNDSKQTAESNVTAMHGNLYFADPTLTPANQQNNYVYILNDAMVVGGGFVAPSEPVAFVGKA